ncbi:kinase-like domain-containing protein [Phycomyces blakesleeanus]|uniref:Kinase-like domain-containing protein n=1 Tax=Phycomyces blakesleeanus TaxID=4837 RepID=A0ABR3AJ19_PHYBL
MPPSNPNINTVPSTTNAPETASRRSLSRSEERRSIRRQGSAHSTAPSQVNRSDSTRKSQDNNGNSVSRKSSERRAVMRIQNYVIYRKTIGAGSMGKVKLAECLTDTIKQKYAVKIMPKIDLTSPAVIGARVKDPKDTPKEREQRTVREMAIMHLLRHPNICQLKEWVSEGDQYYMFLEYVDGGQLLDYIINHGKLREKQARKFSRQIISALDYCHRNSIVHRDLKIENILITRDEDIKIIDFGLSNLYSPSSQLSTFCGSLYFAAPELLQARQYTGPEVDVWSFGVVLYVLVCGRVPFDDTSLPALHAKIKSGIVDDYPDHLSKECVDLLSSLLVVDPKKRATLSTIRAHPWMNKGYDEPTSNHLPHRLPLKTIDMEIVQGMHGFGLGDPNDIRSKLERYISLSEYQQAATKIDQNYQKQAASQNEAIRPIWRRSLISKKKRPSQDDPQSLPAMYDPLVSIYYLVKERKEFEEMAAKLAIQQQRQQEFPTFSSSSLSRSSSSLQSKSRYELPGLMRRKSERTPATNRLSMVDDSLRPQGTGNHRPLTRSRSERTSAALKENATRLFGSVRSSSRNTTATTVSRPTSVTVPASTQVPVPVPVKSLTTTTTTTRTRTAENIPSQAPPSATLSPFSSLSTPSSKKPSQFWWKSDNAGPQRSSWRRLSVSRHGSSRRSLSDQTESSGTPSDKPPVPPLPKIHTSQSAEIVKENTISTGLKYSSNTSSTNTSFERSSHPKSIFNFNRKHLFRLSPQQLMEDLANILMSMNVRTQPIKAEPFSLSCQCDYPEWQKFVRCPSPDSGTGSLGSRFDESSSSDHNNNQNNQNNSQIPIALSPLELNVDHSYRKETLKFTVMIYQARWAGGRLGIKVKEAEVQSSKSVIYQNIYHSILYELEKTTLARHTSTS